MTTGDVVYINTRIAPWYGSYARKPFVVVEVSQSPFPDRILIEWYTADRKQHTRAGSNYALFWIDPTYLEGKTDETAQDDLTCDEPRLRTLL